MQDGKQVESRREEEERKSEIKTEKGGRNNEERRTEIRKEKERKFRKAEERRG